MLQLLNLVAVVAIGLLSWRSRAEVELLRPKSFDGLVQVSRDEHAITLGCRRAPRALHGSDLGLTYSLHLPYVCIYIARSRMRFRIC